MEYGIIVAGMSLFGMLVLTVAAIRMEPEGEGPQVTEREADRELKRAA